MAKQPSYPVKELRSYVRESDNIVCYHPVCVKPKEVFVEQARKIWGDRYDYTDSVYTNNKEPIVIYCPRHDLHFTVGMAQNHLIKPGAKGKATGCPVCSYEQQYGKQYGPEWRETLRLSPKQNRVGLIHPEPKEHKKTPEQIAAEKAEREAKAEARRREEQAYMDQWQAKSIAEANFKKRMAEKYGDHYTFEHMDYKGSCRTVTITCKHHGDFNVEPREILTDRTEGKHTHRECPVCEGREVKKHMTADEFFQRMHQLYDATELDFLTSEFKGKGKKVTAYCRKHGAITHYAEQWLEGKGCEYCNGKFYPPDFLQMARKAQGADYSYRGVNKIESRANTVMVHCGNPEHKWHRMRVDLVLQGCKCRECAGRHQPLEQRREHFRQRVIKKHGTKRFVIAFDEYVNNDTPISVHCLEHHYDYQTTPDNLLRKTGGCPLCTASEGEVVIKGWLDNHDIPHTWHAQIPNEDPTLPLQYVEPDFWLPSYNLYIEYHGAQHYENIDYFFKGKRIRSFAVQQHRDRYLREYCERHGHNLLEIPHWDFNRIDEILTKTLL
jgi:hypothetical protein